MIATAACIVSLIKPISWLRNIEARYEEHHEKFGYKSMDEMKNKIQTNLIYNILCLALAISNRVLIPKVKVWRENFDVYLASFCITSLLPPFMIYDLDYMSMVALAFANCCSAMNVMMHLRVG